VRKQELSMNTEKENSMKNPLKRKNVKKLQQSKERRNVPLEIIIDQEDSIKII